MHIDDERAAAMNHWLWQLGEREVSREVELDLPRGPDPASAIARDDIVILVRGDIATAVARVTSVAKPHEFDRALGRVAHARADEELPLSHGIKLPPGGQALGGRPTPAEADLAVELIEGLEAARTDLEADRRWLPDEPAAEETVCQSWRPASLGELFQEGFDQRYAYVVVDEMVGSGLGLSVAPWPGVDERGRLRFAPAEQQRLIGADRESLQLLLLEQRIVVILRFPGTLDEPEAQRLRQRPIRIGDTFAMPATILEVEEDEAAFIEAAGLRGAPIFDLTVEARQRAKMAMAAALSPPVAEEEARQVIGSEAVSALEAEEEAAEALAATPEGLMPASELAERWRG